MRVALTIGGEWPAGDHFWSLLTESRLHRINWTGAALTTFYAAVRKALVVVLVLRAIGVLVSLAFGLWWVFR